MARKKNGTTNSGTRGSGIQKESGRQNEELRVPEQLSSWSYSPDLNGSTSALEKMGEGNKGKAKTDFSVSQMPENATQDVSVYQRNYQQCPLSNHSSPAGVGPSGGFFEGSNNVEIKGGNFNQTYGHHTNVTVHVNLPPEEYLSSQQQPPMQPSILPSQVQQSSSSKSGPPTHEQIVYPAQFPPVKAYERSPSVSQIVYSPNSSKIYEHHLGLKQRGFPLWLPQLNRQSPMPYRRKGVSIGDVGIITSSGSFSFLFNICLPHGHPINPRILPEDFAPIHPPIEPMDIRELLEFSPESYLASASIEKVHNDTSFRGLSFKASSAEGAVLTLPEGAIAFDIENVARFRAYAAKNIEKWYRYVNGPRGREAKNGDIRLVIGCDKTTSWGIAAVANVTHQTTHYLKYRSLVDGQNMSVSSIPLYKWEYSGMAEAKVGPELKEIEELKRNDDSDVAVEGKYWNQCVFLRTLNPTLNDEAFAAIERDLETVFIQESQQHRPGENSTNSLNNSTSSSSNVTQQQGSNLGTQRASFEPSGSRNSRLAVGKMAKGRVTISRSLISPQSHPADIVNQLILKKFPNCRAVITQDKDWYSVLHEDDKVMPNHNEIAERVLGTNHIRKEDGVIFLERKEKIPSALSHSPASSSAFSMVRSGSENYIARSSTSVGSTPISPPRSRADSFSKRPSLNTSNTDYLPLSSKPDLADSILHSIERWEMIHNDHSKNQRLLASAGSQRLFALLAVTSLGVQTLQLKELPSDQILLCKFIEILVTLAFDIKVVLTLFDALPNWPSLENWVDILSAIASTAIQVPVIQTSGLYLHIYRWELLRFYRIPLLLPSMKRLLIGVSMRTYHLMNVALFCTIGHYTTYVIFSRSYPHELLDVKRANLSPGERGIALGLDVAWSILSQSFFLCILLAFYFAEVSITKRHRPSSSNTVVSHAHLTPMHKISRRHIIRTLCQCLVQTEGHPRMLRTSPSPILHLIFEMFILLATCGYALVDGITTIVGYCYPTLDPFLSSLARKANWIFFAILLVEFVVKVIADGYLLSYRNHFDLFVMIGAGYISATNLTMSNGSRPLYYHYLRTLTVFRLVILDKITRQKLISIIISGANHIFHLTMLLTLYVFPYALWNLKLFANIQGMDKNDMFDFVFFNLKQEAFLWVILIGVIEFFNIHAALVPTITEIKLEIERDILFQTLAAQAASGNASVGSTLEMPSKLGQL